jgi:hypothetical protein
MKTLHRFCSALLLVAVASGFHLVRPSSTRHGALHMTALDRRSLLGAAILTVPAIAHAGIDPALLKALPVQGDDMGSALRLRQVEAIQRPSSDNVDKPFESLPSGVSFREYREGRGETSEQ